MTGDRSAFIKTIASAAGESLSAYVSETVTAYVAGSRRQSAQAYAGASGRHSQRPDVITLLEANHLRRAAGD